MHKDWTSQQCSKVIFSDQSKFCIKFGDREALVWRTKDELYNPACLKRSVKFLTSVMVWCDVGCISTRGVGNIVFLKSTVTYAPYCVYGSVRESPSFIHRGSVWHLCGDEDMIFQQHLAPTHVKGQDMATEAEH